MVDGVEGVHPPGCVHPPASREYTRPGRGCTPARVEGVHPPGSRVCTRPGRGCAPARVCSHSAGWVLDTHCLRASAAASEGWESRVVAAPKVIGVAAPPIPTVV
eukprot:8282564-Pyramimonas_sp.AAC.1